MMAHQKQKEFLKKCALKQNFGHAYMFCGPKKIGKKVVALEWISLIFGQDVFKKQHPDLSLIESENKEIPVGAIRSLIWNLSLKPYMSQVKTAIIDDAHLMNFEAQTALLKTLEEPRGNTILILITDKPDWLLETIISRVQTIKFQAIAKPAEEGSLKQEKEIAKLAAGSLAYRFEYAKSLAQDEALKDTLDIWLGYFRHKLLEAIKNEKQSLIKLKKIINTIQRIKLLITTTNVNPKLALETLMLEL